MNSLAASLLLAQSALCVLLALNCHTPAEAWTAASVAILAGTLGLLRLAREDLL